MERFAGFREALEPRAERPRPPRPRAGSPSPAGARRRRGTREPEAAPGRSSAATTRWPSGQSMSFRTRLRVPGTSPSPASTTSRPRGTSAPRLTTVRQPMRDVGERAVACCWNASRRPIQVRRSVLLPTEVRIRRSCRTPSGGRPRPAGPRIRADRKPNGRSHDPPSQEQQVDERSAREDWEAGSTGGSPTPVSPSRSSRCRRRRSVSAVAAYGHVRLSWAAVTGRRAT